MLRLAKWMAARLPRRWQQGLKRHYYARQLRQGVFRSDEAEFRMLDDLVQPGTWALDVGANIGHYTARLSELIGPSGRVVAFEPIAETFEVLTANVASLKYRNVTLLNAAASDAAAVVGMEVPAWENGLDNYYMARISSPDARHQVLTITVDSLTLPGRVTFAKIDAEGHELSVIRGMRDLLARDRPVLLVEANSPEILNYLGEYGYTSEQVDGSHNYLLRARPVAAEAG